MKVVRDRTKLITAAATAIVSFGLCSILIYVRVWIAFAVFLVIGLIYTYVAITNAEIVTIDSKGVKCKWLFRKREMSWSDIREIGVVGTKVFHREKARYTGSRYIYFSDQEMSDDDRFQMCLKWAPRDKLYLRFSYKKIAKIQRIWTKEIEMYNVGNLKF